MVIDCQFYHTHKAPNSLSVTEEVAASDSNHSVSGQNTQGLPWTNYIG